MKRADLILAVGMALLGPAGAWGGDLGGADIGASWSRLGAEARSAGMAGAMVSVDGGLASLGYNSAGLAGLDRPHATLGYLAWVEGTSLQTLSVGMPLGPGVGAVSLDYFNAGTVDRVQAPLPGGVPQVQGSADLFFLRVGADYAQALGPLQVGGGLRFLEQSLEGNSGLGVVFDLGLRVLTPLPGLSAGLAFQGLGPQIQGASLPGELRLGAAYFIPAAMGVLLSADYSTLRRDSSAGTLDLGAEVSVHPRLDLRAGFRTGSLNTATGLTAGAGFHFEALTLNYAFQGIGALGASHLLSLDWAFTP